MNAMELVAIVAIFSGLLLFAVCLGWRLARLGAGLPAPPVFPALEVKAKRDEPEGDYFDEAIYGKEGNRPTAER